MTTNCDGVVLNNLYVVEAYRLDRYDNPFSFSEFINVFSL